MCRHTGQLKTFSTVLGHALTIESVWGSSGASSLLTKRMVPPLGTWMTSGENRRVAWINTFFWKLSDPSVRTVGGPLPADFATATTTPTADSKARATPSNNT